MADIEKCRALKIAILSVRLRKDLSKDEIKSIIDILTKIIELEKVNA